VSYYSRSQSVQARTDTASHMLSSFGPSLCNGRVLSQKKTGHQSSQCPLTSTAPTCLTSTIHYSRRSAHLIFYQCFSHHHINKLLSFALRPLLITSIEVRLKSLGVRCFILLGGHQQLCLNTSDHDRLDYRELLSWRTHHWT